MNECCTYRLNVFVAGETSVELGASQFEHAVEIVRRLLVAVFDIAEHLHNLGNGKFVYFVTPN